MIGGDAGDGAVLKRFMEMTECHPFRSLEAKAQFLAFYDSIEKKWPVAGESRIVDTSYGQTYVRISGPETASPLVLLHGAYATSLSWAPHIEALYQHYRTFAVDNIFNYGISIYTRIPTGPNDFMTWLEELFNVLELRDPISLMGMSYGGWLAALYAIRFPNRLTKIVLVAPAATVLPTSLKFMSRSMLMMLPLVVLLKTSFTGFLPIP